MSTFISPEMMSQKVYYHNEWQRGLAGLGEYTLKKDLLHLQMSVDDIYLMPSIPLEDIVNSLKEGVMDKYDTTDFKSFKLNDAYALDNSVRPQDSDENVHDLSDAAVTSQVVEAESVDESRTILTCNTVEQETQADTPAQLSANRKSQVIRAEMLIKNGCVSHDPRLQTFTVKGSTGKPHSVTVFPSEYCSCPSTATCYHIMAVKLSLGIPIDNDCKKVNLTLLRRNTRARNQKRCGRKRPRAGDYDVSPAPDSEVNTQLIMSQLESAPPVEPSESVTKDLHITVTTEADKTRVTDSVMPFQSMASASQLQNTRTTIVATRRKRCMRCDACLKSDCGKCINCKDMVKYGGTGKRKKGCLERVCIAKTITVPQKTECEDAGNISDKKEPTTVPAKDSDAAGKGDAVLVNGCSDVDTFLMKYSRERYFVNGDGNCLFNSFSYIIYGTQAKQYDIRMTLVQLIELNPRCFITYCRPMTVEQHAARMSRNYTWGTHVEIFALSLYTQKPVFVALDKGDEYYWAKYFCSTPKDGNLMPLVDIKVPSSLTHFEICHINNNHYDVVLSTNKSLPQTHPYSGESSSSGLQLYSTD